MQLKGAIAAGEFTADGKLVEYKGPLSKEIAKMVAIMCAANSLMGKIQAEGFTKFSGMKRTPFHGCAVAAGDYAVCVWATTGYSWK
jgi:roadblock/LC7 domain-containing protein